MDVKNETISNKLLSDDPNIENMLPSQWKFEITNKTVFGNYGKIELALKIALHSVDDIKAWIKALEEKTNCTYSVRSTEKCSGERVLFKQRLCCHHNTRSKQTYQAGVKNRTRNTKCPSKLNITLRSVRKVFRGQSKNAPDADMPCVVAFVITHNHDLTSPDISRFKRVSESTKEKLMQLFNSGHSPSSALENIKIEIQLSNDDSKQLLADRSVCPDYNYCYHLFMTEFKKQFGKTDFETNEKSFLLEKLEKFNLEMGEKCANMDFQGSEYAIVLCPPLLKRVHANMSAAAEIVYMDTATTVEHDGSKVFLMSTYSQCGALPLAVIITSSENSELISMGLRMLQEILGGAIFYEKNQGPQFFMLDNCEAELIALNDIWPNSKCLLCTYHVLHMVWKWLISSKNGIHREDAVIFFKQFKSVMYASTIMECERLYDEALSFAQTYPAYEHCLNAYWEKRDMWAISYRIKSIRNTKYTEAAMRLLGEKIFNRVKSFNVVQIVDFLMTKFVDYYKTRLLEGAKNRLKVSTLTVKMPLPSQDILDKIEQLDTNLFLVPCANNVTIRYMVNTEVLVCSCISGNIGYICKHIDWLNMMYPLDLYREPIDNMFVRNIFFKIATGIEPPPFGQSHLKSAAMELNAHSNIVAEPMEDDFERDVDVDSNTDMYTITCQTEEEEGESLIQELVNNFTAFVNESSADALPALRQMVARTKQLKTVGAFVTSCRAFSLACRKNTKLGISSQSTSVARRKICSSVKQRRGGGRVGKNVKIKKEC